MRREWQALRARSTEAGTELEKMDSPGCPGSLSLKWKLPASAPLGWLK